MNCPCDIEKLYNIIHIWTYQPKIWLNKLSENNTDLNAVGLAIVLRASPTYDFDKVYRLVDFVDLLLRWLEAAYCFKDTSIATSQENAIYYIDHRYSQWYDHDEIDDITLMMAERYFWEIRKNDGLNFYFVAVFLIFIYKFFHIFLWHIIIIIIVLEFCISAQNENMPL